MRQLKKAAAIVEELNRKLDDVFEGNSPITISADTNGESFIIASSRFPVSCHCLDCDPDEDQLSLEKCQYQLAALAEHILLAFDPEGYKNGEAEDWEPDGYNPEVDDDQEEPPSIFDSI